MKTLVAFKIGRGEKFNNPGHISVLGFNEPINYYLQEDFSVTDGFWCDTNGESLGLKAENDGTGRAENDGDYNTIYVKYLHECNVHEISEIWDNDYDYTNYLRELNIKDFDVLKAFKVSAQDVFGSDDITDTFDAETNSIEKITEEIYDEAEWGYEYEEVDGNFYRREE